MKLKITGYGFFERQFDNVKDFKLIFKHNTERTAITQIDIEVMDNFGLYYYDDITELQVINGE